MTAFDVNAIDRALRAFRAAHPPASPRKTRRKVRDADLCTLVDCIVAQLEAHERTQAQKEARCDN